MVPDRPDGGSLLDPFDASNYLKPKLIKLGTMVLYPDILKKLETVLSRSTYTGGVVRKDIPHERYAEIYYQIE